jgi:hypothetical protein
MHVRTARPGAKTFAVTKQTRILRGGKTVTFADAHIVKDERVAVTIDHDQPGQKATLIQLAAHE